IAKPKRDHVREERMHEEVIVDAYGPEEQAMGWYYYLEDKIRFPFKAKCVISKVISPCEGANLSTFWVWHLKTHARATLGRPKWSRMSSVAAHCSIQILWNSVVELLMIQSFRTGYDARKCDRC